MRAKRRNDEGFNAFFYSLVSQDTQEMYYSSKRQQFLIDQGYAFKVITGIPPVPAPGEVDHLVVGSKGEQMRLLNAVLLANETDLTEEEDIRVLDDVSSLIKRTAGSMKSLSGADDMAYTEYRQPPPQKIAKKDRHKLFKKYMK